jgi:hypothetical protein
VNQILAHLTIAERLSVLYLRKKMLGMDEAKNSGAWEELKWLALLASQRLPLKFKAPKSVVNHTPSYSNLHELSSDWHGVRNELKGILEKFTEADLKKKIYRHIYAGRLNIIHALMFFREHILHHQPQIDRLLKHHLTDQLK